MKTVALALSAIMLAGASAFATNDTPANDNKSYTVNTEKSKIFWNGKKVTGEHSGTLNVKNGVILVENNAPVGGKLAMDMNSITCTDIEDAGTNAKLVGHLKSDDFFGVATHPDAYFELVSFKPIKGGGNRDANYEVQGNLTIKGVTHPIAFPAYVSIKGNQLVASGTAKFDRSKYDIRFGSSSFFEGLGDKAIYDDVELSFAIAADVN
jgi:polyisoprenoid-binding protein YceI